MEILQLYEYMHYFYSTFQMKINTYKRLSFVNTSLVKYNILCGLENLGMADCNKYYIHFFYFEIGPCLVSTLVTLL